MRNALASFVLAASLYACTSIAPRAGILRTDGTLEPHATLAEAIARAPAGTRVIAKAGRHEGGFELGAAIELVGEEGAVLAPVRSGPALVVSASHAVIEGLSLEGPLRIEAGAAATLRDVQFSGAEPLLIVEGSASLHTVRLDVAGASKDEAAIVIEEGGRLLGEALTATGGRSGLLARGGRAQVEAAHVRIERTTGPAVRVLDGALVTLRELHATKTGPAIFAGRGSIVAVTGLDAHEVMSGAVAGSGARLLIEGGVVSQIDETALSAHAGQTQLTARALRITGPCPASCIVSVDAELTLQEVHVDAPGASGLITQRGTLDARALTIEGASSRADPELTHAMHLDGTRSRIAQGTFEAAGIAVVVRGGAATFTSCSMRGGVAALLAEQQARVVVRGGQFESREQPALRGPIEQR